MLREPRREGRRPTIARQPAFGHVVHRQMLHTVASGERLRGVPFHPGLSDEAVGSASG